MRMKRKEIDHMIVQKAHVADFVPRITCSMHPQVIDGQYAIGVVERVFVIVVFLGMTIDQSLNGSNWFTYDET